MASNLLNNARASKNQDHQTWALDVALVHHPIVSKDQKIITTSVTNLDIHDIARSCRTFGVRRYFIVTPLELQVRLVTKILNHWESEEGQIYNRKRQSALSLVQLVPSLEEAVHQVKSRQDAAIPVVHTVMTAAKSEGKTWSIPKLWEQEFPSNSWTMTQEENAHKNLILVFGTGWGLHSSLLEQGSFQLDPINGLAQDEYNHLSVRSAVAIYLSQIAQQVKT